MLIKHLINNIQAISRVFVKENEKQHMDLNGNMLNNLEAHAANSDEQSVVGSNPIIPPLVRSSTGRAIVIQEPRFFY